MTIKRWQTNYISATIQTSKLNYRKLSSNSSEQIIEMGKNGKRKLQMKREREKKEIQKWWRRQKEYTVTVSKTENNNNRERKRMFCCRCLDNFLSNSLRSQRSLFAFTFRLFDFRSVDSVSMNSQHNGGMACQQNP